MAKLNNSFKALQTVFRSRSYYFLASSSMALFVLFEMWLANYSIIIFVFRNTAFNWQDRLSILWSSITVYLTTFSWSIQIITFLVAFFVGINTALLIYYVRQRFRLQGAARTSVLGVIISLFGVGCASCGSVILSSVLGFTIATNVIAVLPLRGKEFSLLAIVALLWSTYIATQKIASPFVCKTFLDKKNPPVVW